MKLTRRRFISRSARIIAGVQLARLMFVSTLLSVELALTGCNAVSDLENWIPVALASMNSIKAILAANGFPLVGAAVTMFNDIIAALNAVLATAKEYASTSPAPVGALQKLQTAIKAVTDQIATFLQQLSLPGGNIVSLVVGLAQIIISTIMAFANKLPTAQAAANTFQLRAAYRVGSQEFNVQAKERSRRKFKKDFNSQLDSGKNAGALVPKAAYLPVSLLERL